MRILALLVSCLLVVGCTMQPVAMQKTAEYKRVGILSAMGDRFATSAVGITVFGNDSKEEQIDFGADDMLTAQAKQILSKKYDVVDLTKYRADFLKTPKYWPGQKGMFASDRPTAQDVVHNLMGNEQLDAYIILTPASASVRGTNQSVGGIGIVKLQRMVSAGDFLLYTAYIVSVVDGKDYSMAGDMRATPIGESGIAPLLGGSALSAPSWPVMQQLWESPAARKTEIRSAFDLTIQQSLPQTFQRAQLIN